jgi:hypothetical protein
MEIEKQKPISAHSDLNCAGLSLPSLSIRASKDSSVSGLFPSSFLAVDPVLQVAFRQPLLADCSETHSEVVGPSSSTSLAFLVGSSILGTAVIASICSEACLDPILTGSSGICNGVAGCSLLTQSVVVSFGGSPSLTSATVGVKPPELDALRKVAFGNWWLSNRLSCGSSSIEED